MAIAGWICKINQGDTTSTTSFTTEACGLVTGKTYEITDRTKRYWSESDGVTVYDNGSPVSVANISSIEYLAGQVVFAGTYSVVGAVTVTGKYYTIAEVTFANNASFSLDPNLEENTTFNSAQTNSGYKTRSRTLLEGSLTVSGFYDSSDNFSTEALAGTEVIVEYRPNKDSSKAYVFKAQIDEDSDDSDVQGLVGKSYTFTSTGKIYREV
jgi:hypothetical protein